MSFKRTMACDGFWSTVCKTIRSMLSDRCLPVCLSVLSCLSVTMMYCGQTIGWIKTKLGMAVGLRPGHTVLGGDQPPFPKGAQPPYPNFRLMFVAKRLDELKCHLVWRWASAQATLCLIVTWLLPPPKKMARTAPPIFGACLLWPNGWMHQDRTWHGGRP